MKARVLFTGLWISFFLLSVSLYSQQNRGFIHQAVIRNASGTIIPSQNLGFLFSLVQGSSSETMVFRETQTVSTNTQGAVNLVIGQGTPVYGMFDTLHWEEVPFFLKVEMDPPGARASASPTHAGSCR